MRKLTLFLCLVFLLCSVSTSRAQQAAKPQQQQPQLNQGQVQKDKDKDDSFTLKVDTQLVVETVVVKDKDGKNIEGLTEKDFTVTEDNVPQTISVFQFQKLDDTPVPAMAQQPTLTAPVVSVEPAKPAQIAPPRLDAQYQDRRLLVLF